MEVIRSSDNKRYKYISSLTKKKYRDREEKYLVEGENPVNEAIMHGIATELVVSEGCKSKISEKAADMTKVTVLSDKLFDSISDAEHSKGIIAVADKKKNDPDGFAKFVDAADAKLLVLENIQDPGNMGTLLRTALGAGYAGAVITKGSADIYAPKVVRSAAGAVMRFPILFTDGAEEAAEFLKNEEFKIYGTKPAGGKDYRTADFADRSALVIGNEGNGMSETFLSLTDVNLTIPMKNETESLNAAVAAGILIYKSVEAI